MKKISARVLQKLNRIERMQRDVKKLVDEVEAEFGIESVTDEGQWSWAMHVDRQGGVVAAKDSVRLLQEFLERKGA